MLGLGISAYGVSSVDFGWGGVSPILASWIVSPLVSGILASFFFLTTKYFILRHPNSFKRGLYAIPIVISVTIIVCMCYVLFKNGKAIKLDANNTGMILGGLFGASVVFAGLVSLFMVYLFIRLIHLFTLRSLGCVAVSKMMKSFTGIRLSTFGSFLLK
jgi:sodium-dependent phosphate transporter